MKKDYLNKIKLLNKYNKFYYDKNNPVVNILFSNVYPVSLSSLQYTNDSTDTEYLSATATFQYQIYDFENLKKS